MKLTFKRKTVEKPTLIYYIKRYKIEFMYIFLTYMLFFIFGLIVSGNIIRIIEYKFLYINTFIQTTPAEVLITSLKIALIMGAYFTLPVFGYYFYKLNPINLSNKNKTLLLKLLLISYGLIILGVLFAYYVAIPFSLAILSGFNPNLAFRNLDISSCISYFITMAFISSIAFEIPLIHYIIKNTDYIPPKLLVFKNRRIIKKLIILSFIVILSSEIIKIALLAGIFFLFYLLLVGWSDKYSK